MSSSCGVAYLRISLGTASAATSAAIFALCQSSFQIAACLNNVLRCAGCCGDVLSVHSSHGCLVPCRCAIQLTVLGYILEPIFAFDAWWLVVIICICMLLISAAEAVSYPTAAYQVTTPDARWVHVDSERSCPSAVNGLLLCTCHQAAFVPWGCNCSGA